MKFKQRRFNRKKKRGEKNKNKTQTKTKTKQKQEQKQKQKQKQKKKKQTKKQKRDLPPLTHPTLLPSIMFSSNYVVARDIICRLSALRYPANTL